MDLWMLQSIASNLDARGTNGYTSISVPVVLSPDGQYQLISTQLHCDVLAAEQLNSCIAKYSSIA